MKGVAHQITTEREVRIPTGDETLDGDLTIPTDPIGTVVFAHGSGSSRKSSRNRFVAHELQQLGFVTLLMDLLTREEEQVDDRTGVLRFDIPFLARRLAHATQWLRAQADTAELPIGYFGASTGGGAALVAANMRDDVRAIVSRGGRPDLAGAALPKVTAPTLLIVGGNDQPVIDMNKQAMARMQAEVKLVIVPGATHLFEEPGTLEEVARLAGEWFEQHLR